MSCPNLDESSRVVVHLVTTNSLVKHHGGCRFEKVSVTFTMVHATEYDSEYDLFQLIAHQTAGTIMLEALKILTSQIDVYF